MRSSWLALLLVAVGACHDLSDELDDARATWRHAAIADYTFDHRSTRFAPPYDVHVTVLHGVVANVQDLQTGQTDGLLYAPTIETLFDRVADKIKGNDIVRVTWDPMFGFPARAYFDGGEEGDGFTVSAFQPSPAP